MDYSEILYDLKDGIATVTLNRPERLNAWTSEMDKELYDAIVRSADNDDVRVIVVTGAGRGFCAGEDMKNLTVLQEQGTEVSRSATPNYNRAYSEMPPEFNDRYTYFPSIPKPIVAAINGPVAGIGFVIAVFCDIRIASDQAKLTTVFSRRGLVAEYGLSWLLPKLIGFTHALELLISGRMVDAKEALNMGLVSKVLPAEGFMDSVDAYAKDLAENVSPRSMRIVKRQFYTDLLRDFSYSLQVAREEMYRSFDSEDFLEGISAFKEKRPAKFSGG